MNKSIIYIARVNTVLYPGVEKKIKQIVGSFNEAGYNAKIDLIDAKVGKVSILYFIKSIWNADAGSIIIRNDFSIFFALFALVFKRCKGARIIIDVPTPIATVLREIANDKTSLATKIKIGLFYIFYPISFWPAHKILQYAEDSNYFLFGVKRKTRIIANGISVNEIPIRRKANRNNDILTFIGVASLAPWHGFDRLIRGIHEYMNSNVGEKIALKFIIVGDGLVRKEWQSLVQDLKMEHVVKFTGQKSGAELDELFDQADIAVASLGLYRKKLNMASELKKREYVARGIPIIASGDDIDFRPPPDFIKIVPNDESSLNVEDIILWYSNLGDAVNPYKIREYAKAKLDFSKKIIEML